MFLNDGDSILIESPAYVGILAHLRPYNLKFTEIPIDKDGLMADKLENVLNNWPAGTRKPRVILIKLIIKIIYTVPNGQNPTGSCTTSERKQTIYKICQEHNLIILEDDPYYYIQFGDASASYFSLDTDGRVLRFDSLSKIISAGFRLGWVSGIIM